MCPGKSRRQKAEGRNAFARRQRRRLVFSFLLSAFCFLLFSCRQKMANQPRYDPLEPSDFFADGMSARAGIAGTVARGELAIHPVVASGKMNGQDIDGFPMPVTAQVLNRGEERF